MKTITKVLKQKVFRRLLLTAIAAFLVMLGADFLASVIREMVAYHTVGTYVMLFAGANAFLSRKKLVKIMKKLAAMGEEDRKFSSPAPAASNASMADVANAFAAAMNGTLDAEEEFED